MNNDLISREALKEYSYGREDTYGDIKQVVDVEDIDNAPKVDTYTEEDVHYAIKEGHQVGYEMAKAKFERPTGKWLYNSDHPDNWICSACNCGWDMWRYESKELKYCPNCGAKMTKEAEND